MIPRPEKLPEVGRNRHLARYLNQLVAWVAQFEIQPGVNYRIKKTSKGTVLTITIPPGSTATEQSQPVWQ